MARWIAAIRAIGVASAVVVSTSMTFPAQARSMAMTRPAEAGSMLVDVRAERTPRCLGVTATIVGTERHDELVGTPGRDVIAGREGQDRIDARGGDDLVCAGGGFDFVRGRAGDDRIVSGRGSDTTHGGPGSDRIRTGVGTVEALFGGKGDDRLWGGPGAFDGLIGGPGDDRMDGGGGRDIAWFFDSPRGVTVDLEADSARGFGSDRVVRVEGAAGSNLDDVLLGDQTSNLLVGQEGDDAIDGRGSGALADLEADQLDGGPGDDTIDGGPGADIASYEDAPGPVEVDLASGTATGWGSDTLADIDAIVGSAFGDSLTGDAQDNAIAAGAGDDAVDGRAGVDEAAFFDALEPVVADLEVGTATGWGSDALVGIENLTGSAFGDTLSGDDGPNTIVGAGGPDALVGRVGADILLGGGGADEADGGDGSDVCVAEIQIACESAGPLALPAPLWLASPGTAGARTLPPKPATSPRRTP